MDSFWGRVLFEVSFDVCLGEGSQIAGGSRAGCRPRCCLMCVWLRVRVCRAGCRPMCRLMCVWARTSCWIRFGSVGQGRKIDDTDTFPCLC